MRTTQVRKYKKRIRGKPVKVKSHKRKLTPKQKQELAQQLRKYMNKNKEVPSYTEFVDQIGPFPKDKVKYADFLQNEGFMPKRRGPLSDEEIITSIRKAKRKLGKVPSLSEYRELEGFPQFELNDRKWNDLLKKAGFDIYEHPTDKDHPNWKEDVKYRALHEYIIRKKPPRKTCEKCGKPATRMELSNKDHQYSRNAKDYWWLCDSCHADYDNNIVRKNYKSRMKVIV